ncbi:pyruvate, phosphate dikinase [PVC group bacterium (ex Bugula neritina AB1)]|nr:pyruvate, phosphate dikinase [PVC group bacterium (ex Bugula neritina AB1)]
MSVEKHKLVYFFGEGGTEGDASMRELLGGKGANLAEMTKLGVPVPSGFTITTDVCGYYYENGRQYPEDLKSQVLENIRKLEKDMGMSFGDNKNPLLLSVRSGAAASLPGMMDTVLNLGLNDETVKGLIAKSGHERFVWDSYRRFMQMFSDVAMGVDHHHFEAELELLKSEKNVKNDLDLSAEDMKALVERYKTVYKKLKGEEFPQNPEDQLWKAIEAVCESWNNDRAIAYREMNGIKNLKGTAVNIQAMVFGNMGEDSSTGVCFSRDPSTGENVFYGEYLINAQGEDVVAGIRTPRSMTKEASCAWAANNQVSEEVRLRDFPSLEEVMPEIFKEIVRIKDQLENHYTDMQDMEFTVQQGKLYFLQTRRGKRTAQAAIKIAVDMVNEKLITKEEALLRVEPEDLDHLLHPVFDPNVSKNVLTKGLNASPGAAVGKVVFNAEDALQAKEEGIRTILVRVETSPEDIKGMDACDGILTARGGATSHAAVVARGMGKCCVAGCGDVLIDYKSQTFKVGDKVVKKNDFISLNGSTGEVILGEVPTIEPELSGNFATLMSWADSIRKLKVRANADTPKDSKVARDFGAEGIGLCRTEHMFFEGDRITSVREMILSDTLEGREKALSKLLPMQENDFYNIFKEMIGLPVTIRLLDPPLHEFLPHTESEIRSLSEAMRLPYQVLANKVEALHESNPMLGHRGCRLAITYPEIYDMQVSAIMRAAIRFKKETNEDIIPEIMIPLVGKSEELSILKANATKIIEAELKASNIELSYLIGTMIEVPRAAVTADKIAESAEFFSFGTNDLTQMGCGFSRDDAGSFLKEYVRKDIYGEDPFQSLDQEGVGELMKIAMKKGLSVNKSLKMGICGEHGGEPSSIDFCHRIGLNYVSCSPFRVPIARLALAQAAIRND